MSKELTPSVKLPLQDWNSMHQQAVAFVKSGLAPASIRTPEQALIVATQGRELGVPFMASMRSIHVIHNKPSLSVQLKLALAMQTGELEDFKVEMGQNEVVAHIKRRSRPSYIQSKFGVKEATAMQLVNKENYEKQPMTMYQWRALGGALDLAFADVLLGVRPVDTPFEELDVPAMDSVPGPEAPTAVQEMLQAQTEYIDVKKESEAGVSSPEVKDLVAEIERMLASMNGGDLDAMNAHLKKLTAWKAKDTKEEKWLEIRNLPNVAKGRPTWLLKIYDKVKEDYEKEAHKA